MYYFKCYVYNNLWRLTGKERQNGYYRLIRIAAQCPQSSPQSQTPAPCVTVADSVADANTVATEVHTLLYICSSSYFYWPGHRELNPNHRILGYVGLSQGIDSARPPIAPITDYLPVFLWHVSAMLARDRIFGPVIRAPSAKGPGM